MTSLGPAGEILRLSGDRAADLHEPVRRALREDFAEFTGPEGISATASTWIISATAPAQRRSGPACSALRKPRVAV